MAAYHRNLRPAITSEGARACPAYSGEQMYCEGARRILRGVKKRWLVSVYAIKLAARAFACPQPGNMVS